MLSWKPQKRILYLAHLLCMYYNYCTKTRYLWPTRVFRVFIGALPRRYNLLFFGCPDGCCCGSGKARITCNHLPTRVRNDRARNIFTSVANALSGLDLNRWKTKKKTGFCAHRCKSIDATGLRLRDDRRTYVCDRFNATIYTIYLKQKKKKKPVKNAAER